MKSVVISFFIAVAIIIGSISYTSHLTTVSNNLLDINNQISQMLEISDYNNAEIKIVELMDYLDEKKTVLAATGNHEELDKIEMNISELKIYTEGKKQTDALSKCMVLEFLFDHLPNNYHIKLENIL